MNNGGDIGYREGDVRDCDSGKATLAGPADPVRHHDEQHQGRAAGDEFGHNQGGGHQAGGERATMESLEARKRDAGHRSEYGGNRRADEGNGEREFGCIDDLVVFKELAVPLG